MRLPREAKAITLSKVDIEHFVAVGGSFQLDGDGGGFVGTFSSGHAFRTGDVSVVGNTAVFVHLQEEVVVHGLYLIPLAEVAAKQSGVEVRGGLVLVIASPIQIVDVKAESQPFVGVNREIRFESFFAVHLISRLVVSQVGIGDVAVCKPHLVGTDKEAGERLDEEGRFVRVPLEEKTREARRTQIAQMVIVPHDALRQVTVLKVKAGSIGRHQDAVAQRFAYLPHI